MKSEIYDASKIFSKPFSEPSTAMLILNDRPL